eukprot:4475456-Pleurochrysis_carterae.AAC.2
MKLSYGVGSVAKASQKKLYMLLNAAVAKAVYKTLIARRRTPRAPPLATHALWPPIVAFVLDQKPARAGKGSGHLIVAWRVFHAITATSALL